VSRSSNDIRKGYIEKLLANGVMKMEPSKKYQSSTNFLILVIIFDWDDTLLCTSYLSGFQFLELSADAKALVKNLDDYAVLSFIMSAEASRKIKRLWQIVHHNQCRKGMG
jgi:hypothetical protein